MRGIGIGHLSRGVQNAPGELFIIFGFVLGFSTFGTRNR